MKKQIVLLSFILLFNGFTQAQVSADAPTAVTTMMDRWVAFKPVFEEIRQKLEALTPEQKQNLQGLINSLEGLGTGKLALVRLDPALEDIYTYVRTQLQTMSPEDKQQFVRKAILKVALTTIKDKLEALTPAQKQNLQGLINSVNALGTGSLGLVRMDPAFTDIYSYVKAQIQNLTPEEKRMFTNFVVLKIIKQKVDDLTPAQKQNLSGLISSLNALAASRPGLVRMEPAIEDIYNNVSSQIKNMTPEQKQMFVQKFIEIIQEPGIVVKQTLIRAIPQTIDVRGILPEQTTGQIPTHQILP